MTLLGHVNFITVFLIVVFLLPIAAGLLRPLSGDRIYASINATISAVLVVLSAAGAFCFAEYLYSNGGDNPLAAVFKILPVFWYSIVSQDVLVYFLVVLIVLVGLNGAFQLLMIPFNKKLLTPLSMKLGGVICSMKKVPAMIVGGLWQLPKSAWLVLVFALLFNFYTLVTSNSSLNGYIRSSSVFRLIDGAAIQPLVSSGAARQIPAFIDSTVDKAVECLSPEGRKLLIKVYINGVTVDDAIVSCPEIDNLAIDLVDAETDSTIMAEQLYKWVAGNISYDREKAESLKTDAFAAPSGAVACFGEKAGVCFDKACLYVAMCRAVGVGVRLVTGAGYNGTDWQDHSWNQIYDDRDGRWINVDPTFGSQFKDYFDRVNFNDDHKDGEIQGEW
jgi:hypothetical protein